LIPIATAFAKNKRVRPRAPFAFGIDAAFRATNDAINQCASTRETDAARPRVKLQKIAIGYIPDGDDLIHGPKLVKSRKRDEGKK
jgi:hypothetical protein